MRLMTMATVVAVAILAAGCGEKTEPTKAAYEPPKKMKPVEEQPHLVIWEDGLDTGRVVLEFKNIPDHVSVTVSVADVQRDGEKYVFPGKRFRWDGGRTDNVEPKIIVYEKDGIVRCAHPEGLWHVSKEKR